MPLSYYIHTIFVRILALCLLFCISACRKLVEVDPPTTKITTDNLYNNDASVNAVLIGIYADMSSSSFASGSGLTLLAGLSADELSNYSTVQNQQQFYNNEVSPSGNFLNDKLWSSLYQVIFRANAIIEGLYKMGREDAPSSIRYIGEAKFLRAFSYFYLVNLYGGVPIVTTTDYKVNSLVSRNTVAAVYEQIITDLLDAEGKLPIDYSFSIGDRGRPNRWAAAALLARTYLFHGNYLDAESKATTVIENVGLFALPVLSEVFLKNSSEAIWQLIPVTNKCTEEAINFILNYAPTNVALSKTVVDAFENADKRKNIWTGQFVAADTTYFFPNKYKNNSPTGDITEYSMVLRLAEMYLVRAEARVYLGKFLGANGAKADIDVIRNRAELPPIPATTKMELLNAIERERQCELFAEWGHRWLDLKRMPGIYNASIKRADEVLPVTKTRPWQPHCKLLPIPKSQIDNDPNMADEQNPGYN